MDNTNGRGAFYYQNRFYNVEVRSVINPKIAFDYEVFGFEAADAVRYEVFYDDVSFGTTFILNTITAGSPVGTEVINIPGGVINVRITIEVKQDGGADYVGFDNFRVYE